jgi:hypothetical protein
MTVTEAFEDIVDRITDSGPDSYMRLCEKVSGHRLGAPLGQGAKKIGCEVCQSILFSQVAHINRWALMRPN